MIIRHTTEAAIDAAAREADVRVRYSFKPYRTQPVHAEEWQPEGVASELTIRPTATSTQRRCAIHGIHRRIAAVCWHGHRDFFRRLFTRTPAAVIISRVARYEGCDDFERTFEPTGDQNIGSRMNPVAHRDACACREGAF